MAAGVGASEGGTLSHCSFDKVEIFSAIYVRFCPKECPCFPSPSSIYHFSLGRLNHSKRSGPETRVVEVAGAYIVYAVVNTGTVVSVQQKLRYGKRDSRPITIEPPVLTSYC